jgi:hypothetical protein
VVATWSRRALGWIRPSCWHTAFSGSSPPVDALASLGLGWWPVAVGARRPVIQRGAPVHSQVAVAGGARGCGSKFFPGAEEAVSSQRLLRDGCATLRSRRIAPTRLLVLFDPFLPQRPGPRVAVLTDAHATGTRGALASLSGRSVSSFRTPNVVGGAGVVRDVVTYGFVFPVRVTQSITFGRTLGYLQRGVHAAVHRHAAHVHSHGVQRLLHPGSHWRYSTHICPHVCLN